MVEPTVSDLQAELLQMKLQFRVLHEKNAELEQKVEHLVSLNWTTLCLMEEVGKRLVRTACTGMGKEVQYTSNRQRAKAEKKVNTNGHK